MRNLREHEEEMLAFALVKAFPSPTTKRAGSASGKSNKK